jgi:hypothetical protein
MSIVETLCYYNYEHHNNVLCSAWAWATIIILDKFNTSLLNNLIFYKNIAHNVFNVFNPHYENLNERKNQFFIHFDAHCSFVVFIAYSLIAFIFLFVFITFLSISTNLKGNRGYVRVVGTLSNFYNDMQV